MSAALLALLLLDIAIILVVAHLCGALLRRLGQPAVLGEIMGGIALGPTLLGALPGDPSALLFPADIQAVLVPIGTVGLVLFMFVAGLELDTPYLRRHDRALAALSFGALALPFALGIGLAMLLYPSHDVVDGQHVELLPFAIFVATALSITAFPVLVRIAAEHGLRGTRLGELAIASAAVQDAAGWLLLAVALAAHTGGSLVDIAWTAIGGLAFVLILAFVLRPLLRAVCARSHQPGGLPTAGIAVFAMLGLAACAYATHRIGLHGVIGAFAFGVAFPRREAAQAIETLRRAILPLTMAVLLPLYFLSPGLHINLRELDVQAFGQFLAVMICACVGKIAGAYVPARLTGSDRREAWALGTLLNTRGLVEIVVLTVGLEAGVLDRQLYAVMVLMALCTTLATGPALRLMSGLPLSSTTRPALRLGLE